MTHWYPRSHTPTKPTGKSESWMFIKHSKNIKHCTLAWLCSFIIFPCEFDEAVEVKRVVSSIKKKTMSSAQPFFCYSINKETWIYLMYAWFMLIIVFIHFLTFQVQQTSKGMDSKVCHVRANRTHVKKPLQKRQEAKEHRKNIYVLTFLTQRSWNQTDRGTS